MQSSASQFLTMCCQHLAQKAGGGTHNYGNLGGVGYLSMGNGF